MIIELTGGLDWSLRLSEGAEASQRRVEMIRINDLTDQLESS